MDHPRPRCDDFRRNGTWTRHICCIAAALIIATAAGVMVLFESFDRSSSELFGRPWLREREKRPAKPLSRQGAGCVASAVIASSGTGGPDIRLRMQEEPKLEGRRNDMLEEGLVKYYSTFLEYALESYNSTVAASLPVPVVNVTGQIANLSIPIITIIGAQKGGTTNLRQNLLSHPMVGGKFQEVDFFDRQPGFFPPVAQWEGEGLGKDIGSKAAAKILLEYARACVSKRKTDVDCESDTNVIDRIIVDSSPEYIICPIVPYRMKMVRPGAKFVVVLRDPTDRYFSQLRMDMCRDNHQHGGFASMAEKISTLFHLPGEAEEYLAMGEVDYEPYTALCRGENASTSDLWTCYLAMKPSMPLYRGLYADQLERWFRVFDRSQIMVIDASDMLADFSAVVNVVAKFAGLPEHSFMYDASHEHKTGCSEYDNRTGNHYFVHGGRYDAMFEEVELFREWYRPHNERLYELLDRDFMWQ